MKSSAILFLFFVLQIISAEARKPLFSEGPESFTIQDENSKTPVFKIFSDTATKRSLALAINAIYNFSSTPAGPAPYIELHLEKVFLRLPKKDSDLVNVFIKASGREFDLGAKLPKADLLKGNTFKVTLPPDEQEVGLFIVTTKGNFKLRYSPKEDLLYIDDSQALFSFKSPMANEEKEEIKFRGKAVRD